MSRPVAATLLLCVSSLSFTPTVQAGCTDADGDGYCVGVDCDDSLPSCTLDCTDADRDGVCFPADCHDGSFGCAYDCADGDGDAVCDESDNCPDVPNPSQPFFARLSDPPLRVITTELPVVTPDGATVVYRAHQGVDTPIELHASHLSGTGSTRKLNPSLASDSQAVTGFALSPDGATVVYRADADLDEHFELFAVPLAGGAPIELSDVVGEEDVEDFLLSPDGSTVFYRADQTLNDMIELYSVPISGGTPVKISSQMPFFGDVAGASLLSPAFLVSPDGTRVAYLADREVDGQVELYVVPAGGGTAVKLNGPLVSGGDVSGVLAKPPAFQFSPDGTRVIYLADQEVNAQVELYSVPIGGGVAVKLNGPLPATGDVASVGSEVPFQITPDSTRVVYLADHTMGLIELFSVPIDGGGFTQLNGPIIPGGDVGGQTGTDFSPFRISPDGTRVVYTADAEVDNQTELYSVSINGGGAVKLNTPLGIGGDVAGENFLIPPFELSPDGSRVVFLADQVDNRTELFSVPIGGGAVVKLNGPLVTAGDVAGVEDLIPFLVSPDSAWVFYLAQLEQVTSRELYRVPIEGGPSDKLNGPMIPGGAVAPVSVMDPSGSVLVFVADQGQHDALYRISATFDAASADADQDGSGAVCDCDDEKPHCSSDCNDLDGDGFCADSDCDDLDLTVRFVPTEVVGVTVQGPTATMIQFESQDDTAGPSTSYHVVAGDLGELIAGASYATAVCLGTFGDAAALDPLAAPASGAGRYYLVRAVNSCGSGTYGDASVAPDPRDELDSDGVCP